MADHHDGLIGVEVGLQCSKPCIGLAQGAVQHRTGEGSDRKLSLLAHIHQLR